MHWIKKGVICVFILLMAVTVTTTTTFASNPLVEKLKEKGILGEEEAREIEKEIEEKGGYLPKGLADVSFGALAYLDYSAGEKLSGGARESYNEFAVTRGYLTLKKKVTPWFSVRSTLDIKQETAGTGSTMDGSWVARFKYYYAQFNWPDMGFLTNNKTEFGMGHMPWLDFAEHVNPYRCQGTMFQERNHNFNSADLGVSLAGYFGGEMDADYKKNVTKYYAGKYGSYHIGLYNGAGYHAKENNNNKVLEYRITVRPLPDVLPGLQLTYFGLNGKGNSATFTGSDAPDWRINTAYVSYQHEYFTITGEYIKNKGNQAGTWVKTGTNDSKDVDGYSVFGFVRIPGLEALRVHGRYDVFDPDDDTDDDEAELLIAGLSYDVHHHNMVMLNYERTDYEKNNSKVGVDDYEDRVQLVYQIAF